MGGRSKTKTSVQELVEQFGRWFPGEPDPEELDNLDLMLTVRWDYLSEQLCTWHEGDITELLLGVFPRKVQSDASLLRDGPRVLERFLSFLEQSGRLRGSGIYQVHAELADVAPKFAFAMTDASRFGLAKSLFASMSTEGVDMEDPRAVEQWIGDFNARSFSDRGAITDDVVAGLILPPEPEVVLPPVTLASEDELRRAATAAPLVVQVEALLAHVGPQGRPVTQTGALRLVDAKALASACGDDERLHRPAHWRGEVRRMADLPGVTEAYLLAVAAELLDVSATRVRRDPSQPGVADPLARSAALAAAALDLGVFLGDAPHRMEDLVDAVSGELPGVLSLLYRTGEPVAVEELAGRLADGVGVDPAGSYEWEASTVRSYLERSFDRFERLGMLERLGVHVSPGRAHLGLVGEQVTSVRLTPLGVWWLQQTLVEFGFRAPVRGALAELGAGELCDGMVGYSVEDGQAELRGWSQARGADEAARQLAALLADAEVTRRLFALHVLDEVPGAEQAVRPLLDDPAARPYARMWLQSRDLDVAGSYLNADDELLLFVDTAGMLVELGAGDELVQQLPALGEPGRQVDFVRRLWRVDSPFTEPLLQTLADSAPPVVSKAARKALHSLRSARGH